MRDRDTILIVDDDADVRGALAAILEIQGYDVVVAENGREALDVLRVADAGVCLILLDLFMPEMDGWAFRSEQLKDPRLADIPVIVMSADSAAARRAVQFGVVAAMTKPVEYDPLLHLVAEHC
jgi:CheY-like chemotaxis protein